MTFIQEKFASVFSEFDVTTQARPDGGVLLSLRNSEGKQIRRCISYAQLHTPVQLEWVISAIRDLAAQASECCIRAATSKGGFDLPPYHPFDAVLYRFMPFRIKCSLPFWPDAFCSRLFVPGPSLFPDSPRLSVMPWHRLRPRRAGWTPSWRRCLKWYLTVASETCRIGRFPTRLPSRPFEHFDLLFLSPLRAIDATPPIPHCTRLASIDGSLSGRFIHEGTDRFTPLNPARTA